MGGFEQKLQAIRALLDRQGLDALWLRNASSFAWATGGSSAYINTATSFGEASLLVTPDGGYLISNTVEAPRLEKEEGLKEQGWEFRIAPWYGPNSAVADLTRGMKLGADSCVEGAKDLSGEVARLRTLLTAEEQERFRTVSQWSAEAMDEAIRKVRPGQTEYEIAAMLGEAAQERGAQPIVNLIATDERIFSYRHPLPTAKKMETYAMLVLCGRWKGVVCSITRLIHFGKLPDELRQKSAVTASVDAAFITGTRPGRTLGDVFADAQAAYAAGGYPDEWTLHHQGGPAGFEPREWVATPGMQDVVSAGQVYAWNPSVTGTKSEDSVLITDQGVEVLTSIPGWPVLSVPLADGSHFDRPAILEVV